MPDLPVHLQLLVSQQSCPDPKDCGHLRCWQQQPLHLRRLPAALPAVYHPPAHTTTTAAWVTQITRLVCTDPPKMHVLQVNIVLASCQQGALPDTLWQQASLLLTSSGVESGSAVAIASYTFQVMSHLKPESDSIDLLFHPRELHLRLKHASGQLFGKQVCHRMTLYADICMYAPR